MLRLIMVFAFMNLVVNMGSMGLYSALILSRPAGGKSVLSMVTAAIGIGTLIGSLIVAGAKPAKSRTRTIFASCILSCLFYDFALSLGQNPWIWCSAAAIGNVFLPFINANLTATMRIKVPVSIQGRVISAQTTLQCFTIPVGLFLGGILADHVFEPFMQGTSGPAEILRGFLGTGKGSGIALLILIQAVISLLVCVFEYLSPSYRSLDNDEVLL